MILLTVLIIVVPVILILAFFARTAFSLEREIVIKRPRSIVFDYLKLLKNQDNYGKWVMIDPAMKKSFSGEDGRVGFIYAWESKNKKVGQVQQEITSIREPERIELEFRFLKPFPSTAHSTIEVVELSNQETKVKWTYRGNPSPHYILRVAHLLFRVKKVVGNYIQTSLTDLKTQLER
jgi:uncharacterized protein YndB with AHSA1/START domain